MVNIMGEHFSEKELFSFIIILKSAPKVLLYQVTLGFANQLLVYDNNCNISPELTGPNLKSTDRINTLVKPDLTRIFY